MMTAKAAGRTAIERKLEYLTALISHAGTTEVEVKAAKSARARLAGALEAAAPGPANQWEPRWTGEKYQPGRYLPGTEITALIRAEIKVARALAKYAAQPGEVAIPDPVTGPIAAAPPGIRFGARILHHGSIAITVENVPAEWGYGTYGEDFHGNPCEAPSPALYELGVALDTLGNQWNYDDSDPQVDHFNRGYYLNVYDEAGRNIGYVPSSYRYRWML